MRIYPLFDTNIFYLCRVMPGHDDPCRCKNMNGISNNEIKYLRSLSQKKFRDECGVFVVEGEKMVAEALKSGFEVEKIWREEEIGSETMARISSLASPSPVLAVVKKPGDVRLEGEEAASGALGRNGLFLALDTLRDPGNLGTIIRIADWFGVNGIFATPDTVELFNPKVVQATMGAIFRVKFHYIDLQMLADAVENAGGKLFGTFLDGQNIYEKDLSTGDCNPAVIVIGNESNGISPQLGARITERLFIPSYPAGIRTSESLNAAVATAITVAEFRRRASGRFVTHK